MLQPDAFRKRPNALTRRERYLDYGTETRENFLTAEILRSGDFCLMLLPGSASEADDVARASLSREGLPGSQRCGIKPFTPNGFDPSVSEFSEAQEQILRADRRHRRRHRACCTATQVSSLRAHISASVNKCAERRHQWTGALGPLSCSLVSRCCRCLPAHSSSRSPTKSGHSSCDDGLS